MGRPPGHRFGIEVRYALVSLNVPIRTSSFTYSYDETAFPDIIYRRVCVPFGARRMTGFVLETSDVRPEGDFEIKGIIRVIDKEMVITSDLVELGRGMSHLYKASLGQCLSLMVPNARREVENSPFYEQTPFSPIERLTPEQDGVISRFWAAYGEGRRLFYLYGVTGSGKSEVYLRIAQEVIRRGGQVLYLVPEITLTEQMSADVYLRFSKRVSILHSALTASQRLKAAAMIRKGEVDLVIGARSACFAPFRNLGLIILDEEHENSYKSGSTPRYHARQVAQMRSRISSCPLIMGSATPSFEAFEMMREGRIETLRMNSRIGRGAFPSVRIVSILGQKGNISPILAKEMSSELDKGNGVILFLNRRGYAHGIVCNSCGEAVKCPNCSISLTYHKSKRRLVCHTCGYSESLVESCPSCHSHDLVVSGGGTEMIEEELRMLFPFKRIVRLDSDSADGNKKFVAETLASFKNGETDILLGTQMIAKGLNFPKATLVGVVNADATIFLPDFRADERTFQLLEQVAGRVGRYRADGKVIIQTSQVSNPAIRAVENRLGDEFYYSELAERRKVGFPPYCRLVNLTIRSKNGEKACLATDDLHRCALSVFNGLDGIEVFPPSSCLIERKNTYYRYHVLVRSSERAFPVLLNRLDVLLASYKVPSSTYLEIDTDPVDMM